MMSNREGHVRHDRVQGKHARRHCFCIFALAFALAAQTAKGEPCSPQSPSQQVSQGVRYYDCTDKEPAVHIVTIERGLKNMDMQLLSRPASQAKQVVLTNVETLASDAHAVVAINGFYWTGGYGVDDCNDNVNPNFPKPANYYACRGTPDTPTFFNGQQRSDWKSDITSKVLLGFSSGPAGIEPKRIPLEDFDKPENAEYRHTMFGAKLSVMHDGQPRNDASGDSEKKTIIGYTQSSIFLLASAKGYKTDDLDSTFATFGVTDAVLGDGSTATELFVAGKGLVADSDRKVAYSLALVPSANQCTDVADSTGASIGSLCLNAGSDGYDAQFTVTDDGRARCGDFDFNLVAKDGTVVGDKGAFAVCTNEPGPHSYYFQTGTMGGCVALHLYERSGADFGRSEWSTSSCGDSSAPPAPPAMDIPHPHPTSCGYVTAGQELGVDESLLSCNGRYQLKMQSDGNLVLYTQSGRALWASDTWGTGGDTAVMQDDGNFVLYDGSSPLWASNTWGYDGSYLAMQDDGNLVVYADDGTPLWASDTYSVDTLSDAPSSPSTCGYAFANQELTVDQSLWSCNSRYQLKMQSDGNLVLYTQSGRALWASDTWGTGGDTAIMQSDGNFVLYDGSAPLWASNTLGYDGSYLARPEDGNLVVYANDGTPLWASGTYSVDTLDDGSVDTLSNAPTSPSGCGYAFGNQQLTVNQSLWSCNGRYQLKMQSDGNLVLYTQSGRALWASNTWGTGGDSAIMQDDGNFVLYDGSTPLWSSDTWGFDGAYLGVQDDGNLVVYDSYDTPLWATNTYSVDRLNP
jgi:hypothetical protein